MEIELRSEINVSKQELMVNRNIIQIIFHLINKTKYT